MVKSRRSRSSFKLSVNSTFFGCLLSSYSPSILYVVTSYPTCSSIIVTVPCCIPVSIVFLKSRLISSGLAEVVISQSCGFLSKRVSLTHPPTAYASYPACSSLLIIYETFFGNIIFNFISPHKHI